MRLGLKKIKGDIDYNIHPQGLPSQKPPKGVKNKIVPLTSVEEYITAFANVMRR